MREKLGLPDIKPSSAVDSTSADTPALPPSNKSEKRIIVFEDLSPKELIAVSYLQV